MPPEFLISRLKAAAGEVPQRKLGPLIKELEQGLFHPGQVTNKLMSAFRDTRSVEIFTLLYELNFKTFLSQIVYKLKRYGALAEGHDILQEVFLSIFRYARTFREEHHNSFRNWTQSIIRNAILKHLERTRRGPPVHELGQHVIDPGTGRSAVERLEWKEHLLEGSKIYCLSLALYLHLYQLLLTPREKKALHKVEVENLTYRAAAEAMGIRLENFKMAVSRARKKIYYGYRSDLYFRRAQSMKTTG